MIEIRPIRRGDEANWRRLWREYLDFYEASLPEGIFASSFARLTDPDVLDYQGLILEADGDPAGLAHYIFHRHGWQIEDICYLQDLYVVPSARGKRCGRALIEAVYQAADTRGCPNVYWLTQDFNTEARKLYDRIGTVTPFVRYKRMVS